jgi:hypothetical protein
MLLGEGAKQQIRFPCAAVPAAEEQPLAADFACLGHAVWCDLPWI